MRVLLSGLLAASLLSSPLLAAECTRPAEHTALWLADSGGEPDPDEYDEWLSWFDSERVEAVGTGVIALRRTGGAAVVIDEVPEPGAPVSGPEVSGHLDRSAWLRGADLMRARLRPGPGVVLAQEAVVGAEGWEVAAQLVRAGVRRTGTDAVGVELVGACDGERRVGRRGRGRVHGQMLSYCKYRCQAVLFCRRQHQAVKSASLIGRLSFAISALAAWRTCRMPTLEGSAAARKVALIATAAMLPPVRLILASCS